MSLDTRTQCRKCGATTSHEHLRTFGAQCFPCYQRWVHEKRPSSPDVGNKQANGPRDWIQALSRRDPKTLTQFQRECLAEAQRMRSIPPETE